jgi:GntR family transcriptional regulator, transcriptional repressor for pyruvate dehydrogenase complex
MQMIERKGKSNIRVIKTESLRTQVYAKLKEQIMRRIWKEGEKLPSENELCVKFGVSRVTIRAAIQQLEILGLLEIRQGEGTFVKNITTMRTVDAFNSVLTSQSRQDIVVILEYRKIIEKGSVGLAQEKVTHQDIQDLEKIYVHMVNSKDVHDYIKADWAFHYKIAEITRNSLVLKVFEFLNEILSVSLTEELNMLGQLWGIKQHRAIIDALKIGVKQKVETLMEKHIEGTLQEVLKREKIGLTASKTEARKTRRKVSVNQ